MYKYKAFISYRHIEPDKSVAKKLHSLLETYNIPKKLRIEGNKKLGKVFRDEEELPLSSDLGKDIKEALEDSEWLIVICSPELLKSKWCMAEIDTFIELGKRDKILAVLVSGTPEESFPPQLMTGYVDGKQVAIEPLAANVVSDNNEEALKKLKSEKLRLIAPMLDVGYDDLRQRDKRRKTRLIVTAISIIISLLSIFLVYAIYKNRQITNQRNESMIAESKWLAKSSFEAIDSNNPTLAMELALEALPSEKQDRPIVDEAINALYSSMFLKAHDNYETLYVIDVSELGGNKYEDILFSCNENNIYLYREDNSACYEYDIQNGLFKEDVTDEANSYKSYIETLESLTDDSIKNKDMYEGYHFEGYISDYKRAYNQDKHDSTYLASDYLMTIYDYNNSKEIMCEVYEDEVIHTYSPNKKYERKYYGKGQYNGLGQLFKINSFGSSYDGRYVYILNGYDLYLFEESSEEIIKVLNYKDVDNYFFCGGDVSNDQPLISFITTGGNGYVYNYIEDKIITFDNGNHTVDSVKFNSDGTRILALSKTTNTCDIYSGKTGEMILSFSADFEIEHVDYGFKDIDFYTELDTYIIMGSKEYVQVLRNSGANNSNKAFTVLADAYSTSWNDDRTPLLNNDGTLLWSIREGKNELAIKDRDYRLTAYDIETGKIVFNYPSDVLMSYLERVDNYIINYGLVYYPKDESVDSYAGINIFDINTGEMIHELKPTIEVDGKKECYFTVVDVILNDDKTLLYAVGERGSGIYTSYHVFIYDFKTGDMLWETKTADDGSEYYNGIVFNNFVENDVLRVNSGYSLHETQNIAYYDAYTGKEIEYEEDIDSIESNVEEKESYLFDGHNVSIEDNCLIDVDTKERLIDFRKEVEILDECSDGKKLLITYYDSDPSESNIKGQLYILNVLTNDELIEEANRILDGKTLSEEQKEMYFLND